MALDEQLICIFGGGGFLGRYIAERLLAGGARLRIAERDPKNAMYIKPLGDLGQVQFASADVTKPESIERAVYGCDAVINLVGVFGKSMDVINDGGAGNVARAAANAGCKTLVHMSAIGADAASPSQYGRSKAAGEAAVVEAFSDAIIMRPSIVFGREDQFINRFAGLIAMLPAVPIIGSDTKFQPVYVCDVAKAVAAAVSQPERHRGRVFELGGPEVMSMGELNQRIAKLTGRDLAFFKVPDFAAKLLAICTGFMPGAPINSDQLKMLQKDNVVSGNALGLNALSVSATSLTAIARGWLEKYAVQGRFGVRAKAG